MRTESQVVTATVSQNAVLSSNLGGAQRLETVHYFSRFRTRVASRQASTAEPATTPATSDTQVLIPLHSGADILKQ